MPSTTSATIIMVANTGRLMEMSERNMSLPGGADVGFLAGDGDLHAAAKGADVADDHAVARLQPIGHLHEAQPVIGGADLHGRHVEGGAVDAIDVRLAILGRLA